MAYILVPLRLSTVARRWILLPLTSLSTGACDALVLTSYTPTRVGVANPRHLLTRLIIPYVPLLPPDTAHALVVHSRQCLQVLEARVFSLLLARRYGDQPTSLV